MEAVHQVEDKEFWTQDFQRGRSQKEYNERYYEEMGHLVNAYSDYSVLGHMDLIVRYDEEGIYPFDKIEPMVLEILKRVIERGKGIEGAKKVLKDLGFRYFCTYDKMKPVFWRL